MDFKIPHRPLHPSRWNVIWIILNVKTSISSEWNTPQKVQPEMKGSSCIFFRGVYNISHSPLLWLDKSIHQSNPSKFHMNISKKYVVEDISYGISNFRGYFWCFKKSGQPIQNFKEGCPPQQENVQGEFVIWGNEMKSEIQNVVHHFGRMMPPPPS